MFSSSFCFHDVTHNFLKSQSEAQSVVTLTATSPILSSHPCFICVPVCLSSVPGRLLDATKNYMYVFLLAGSEVVLSALVLATCNFLFIKKKSSVPADKLKNITVTDDAKAEVCSELAEMTDEEEKGAREEQEKEAKKEVIKEEEEEEEKDNKKIEEVRPESVTVDVQEVERFLKEPQQNGDVATCPETCL